jgi:microsomal epoxide hydrolase
VAVTASFRALYIFVIIEHASRRLLHWNVTSNPTTTWTLQQLREAIASDHPYRFLVHDRDSIYAQALDTSIANLRLRVLSGLHLNMIPVGHDPAELSARTPEESRYLEELRAWLKEESGYGWIQGTRPQTLAFALTDSPAGLAAWIMEKFRAWSDCNGDLETVFTRDQLLANVGLYWFTGAIGSSFWPYYARRHSPWQIKDTRIVTVPTGYCEFPREIVRPPRSVAERTFTDIRRWSVMPRGGHFAAMEQPEALAEEIRELFRPLRSE